MINRERDLIWTIKKQGILSSIFISCIILKSMARRLSEKSSYQICAVTQ